MFSVAFIHTAHGSERAERISAHLQLCRVVHCPMHTHHDVAERLRLNVQPMQHVLPVPWVRTRPCRYVRAHAALHSQTHPLFRHTSAFQHRRLQRADRRCRAQSTALRLRALSVGCRRGRPIAATLYTHSLIHFLYHDNVLSNQSNSRNYSITVLIFVPVTTPFSPEISERGGPPPEKILLLVIINSIKYINWRS